MILKRPEIVVGSSLPAVLYAFNNGLPLFYSESRRPFRFDYLEPDVDTTSVKLCGEPTLLKTFEEDKAVGLPKSALWERLLFIMSLNGQIPLGNMCDSMRFTGDTLVFADEYAKLIEVGFDTCYYFGDQGCLDFVEESVDDPRYICYDWIAFNRGGKHEIDYFSTSDKFVREVWFYPSDRIDGNTQVKDACVVSHLTHEQLEDFNFSETTARFKLVHEMESRGMKGPFNGFGPNGTAKYYKFRTTYISRRVGRASYAYRGSSAKITIASETEKDLIAGLSQGAETYQKTIKHL